MEKVVVLTVKKNGTLLKRKLSLSLQKIIYDLIENEKCKTVGIATINVEDNLKFKQLNWKEQELKTIKKTEELFNEISKRSPELKVYRDYFKKFVNNNSYIVIMKQAVINYMIKMKEYEPQVTNHLIGLTLNLSHSTVSRLVKNQNEPKHPDYIEVVGIMDKMINQGLYPHTKKLMNDYVTKTIYEWK